MRRVCGWCKKELGVIKDSSHPENTITTGICEACADFFAKNQPDRPMSDFLNSLSIPVAVVDKDCKIQFANEKACAFLGKKLEEFQGSFAGDAFECAYARMPGGCGRTEHCKACAIRISVQKTYQTGKNQEQVTACLTTSASKRHVDKHFIISTAKEGDVVFLKIETLASCPKTKLKNKTPIK